ncbi:uncharacterized protein TM35_000035050 [Trypanosoma theileri]|uniref:Uncharacterized protein n=1 Tax=Trypanosoma theileri TaxID=67003 RepID=A0A1X0P750_9TRYP|nr:uncharacterized protein TM35_000035050 [Trypanosoma theileri]ORC92752.1 hypothetical protein TM35_000035050 [Trypanosoma theileri]
MTMLTYAKPPLADDREAHTIQLGVNTTDTILQLVEEQLLRMTTTPLGSGSVRENLSHLLEVNAREQFRLKTSIVLEESRLRAVQKQIAAIQASITLLNDKLNCT